MAKKDIIVIGTSAEGLDPLIALAQGLPKTFSGCVFIVQHTAPYASSRLPEILSQSGPLKAVHAKNDEMFRPGKIYVAPPDHHMLL